MPAVVLTGGRVVGKRRAASSSSRRRSRVSFSKFRCGGSRSRRGASSGSSKRSRTSSSVTVPSPATASPSERAALQNLAQRLQRGQFTAWRSANYPSPAASEAALAAASSGAPATARDLTTGTTATAVPVSGSGGVRRRRRHGGSGSRRSRRRGKQLKGGILPALIPIIAAAIGAIPGIAGTAVGIASLKEQQRQFNKMYNNSKK
ncbi:pX [Aviadenovirus cerasi]|uniref:PX n=1 Tax=Fowl aviadenovirus 5 TaxID=172861 RepID=A0A6M3Z7Y5_9ADEN|nr:pX [Fowl aviadenovirus 5]